jgi:hypothetical protein
MPRRDGSTDASTEAPGPPQAASPGTSSPTPGEAREETFVGRWSRRKRMATESGQDPHARSVGPEDAPAAVLGDADMPPLSSLDGNADYSGFMSEGVSEELRRAALRKLFLSPQFNVRDGLNDYDEDFTAFEHLGDVVTSDMRHQQELQAQREREARELAAREEAAGEEAPREELAQEEAPGEEVAREQAVEGSDAAQRPALEQGARGDAIVRQHEAGGTRDSDPSPLPGECGVSTPADVRGDDDGGDPPQQDDDEHARPHHRG